VPMCSQDYLCWSLSLELSNSAMAEDHVWFEDRWMVASLCDEWLTTFCGLILG
jgi:hypothetical protein